MNTQVRGLENGIFHLKIKDICLLLTLDLCTSLCAIILGVSNMKKLSFNLPLFEVSCTQVIAGYFYMSRCIILVWYERLITIEYYCTKGAFH